jgi:hypothetical protein
MVAMENAAAVFLVCKIDFKMGIFLLLVKNSVQNEIFSLGDFSNPIKKYSNDLFLSCEKFVFY